MPQLNWSEYEFIECLEAISESEHKGQHRFAVQRAGLELIVTVWQLESIVELSIRQLDQKLAMLQFVLVIRDGVRHLKGPSGAECLEFRDVFMAPRRFSYNDYPRFNWYDSKQLPGIEAVRVFSKPLIRIELTNSPLPL